MKNLKFHDKIIYFINLLLILTLSISLCAKYVKPDLILSVAYFGLLLPYLYLLNLIFLVYWIWKKKRAFVLPLILSIGGWMGFQDCFGIKMNAQTKNTAGIKLTSWNVRLFDLYNWTNNQASKKKIFNFLDSLDSDIYCFQEFYNNDKKKSSFKTIKTLPKLLKTKYKTIGYKHRIRKKERVGLVTLSKYPIINSKEVHFKNEPKNLFIYSDIILKGDTIRLFNIHLASVKLQKNDYQFIDQMQEQIDSVNIEHGLRSIYRRLRTAFKLRANQVEELNKDILKSPYPVFIAGDFNDTPGSYSYQTLTKGLVDSFLESGFGFGGTYNGKIKTLRIDYILHDKNFESIIFNIDRVNLSDHFPITCTFQKSNSSD